MARKLPVGIDSLPAPHQGSNRDDFFLNGVEISVQHRRDGDWRRWANLLSVGEGTSGWPMPVICAHGLTAGVLLVDADGQGEALTQHLATFPERLRAETAKRAYRSMPGYLDVLEQCVTRRDGLLFYSELADAARLAWIAWFAAKSRYWPHEKRLGIRLRNLGRGDLASAEEEVWSSADPAAALSAFRSLVTQLFSETPNEQ